MIKLTLQDEQSFGIGKLDKKVRLIVYRDGVENVCRMESAKKLEKFVQSGEGHLFKGRLQLYRQGDEIGVIVKGKIAGTVNQGSFYDMFRQSVL
jgi:hypothetical protein